MKLSLKIEGKGHLFSTSRFSRCHSDEIVLEVAKQDNFEKLKKEIPTLDHHLTRSAKSIYEDVKVEFSPEIVQRR